MPNKRARVLIALAVPIWNEGGDIIFERKAHAGLHAYQNYWSGDIRLLLRRSEGLVPQFGFVRTRLEELPFELSVLAPNEALRSEHLLECDLVHASADDFRLLSASRFSVAMGVPCIYTIEYTHKTRQDICQIEQKNILRRWRSLLWLERRELERRRAFALASGIQANGVPAYKAYQHLCSSVIQYFDTRASAPTQITDPELETRHISLRTGQPIRLGFSGRLARLKGANDLVKVAFHLRNLNVPFTLDIFGDGALGDEMKNQIEAIGLSSQVRIHGVVEFESELMPFMKRHIDLFICCHQQADPSCTYMETLSCGVPIVGYANEALQGLVEIADVGWVSDMSDPSKIAERIAALSTASIIEKSRNAITLARHHSFETTFEGRVNHWGTVLDREARI